MTARMAVRGELAAVEVPPSDDAVYIAAQRR
jgi:hypothetical protein